MSIGSIIVKYFLFQLFIRPFVLTTSCPFSTKKFTIFTASFNKPPGFPRKSKINPFNFILSLNFLKASPTEAAAGPIKFVNFI